MKITYDKSANAAYIYLQTDKKVKNTLPSEVTADGPMVYIDVDEENKIIGFEILDASLFLSADVLKQAT